MSTVFLHPKRKTYYHRSVVPRRLQPYFKGRQQLWRSLKTENKDEATLKSAQWTARIQHLVMTLKKQGDRMTDEQREALVAHWLEVELDEAEDTRTLNGYASDDYQEGVWHVLSDLGDAAHEALVTNNWKKVEREADALLQAAGQHALDHEGADFGRLCRRLLVAKQEYLRIESERWEGSASTTIPVVCAEWKLCGSKAAWLHQTISQRPELDWYWIDDDMSAKELENNQLSQERCVQVSPTGAGRLGELREELERLRSTRA